MHAFKLCMGHCALTEMAAKVFNKLDSLVLPFLPEFDMAILASSDDEVRPVKGT